MTGCTSGRHPGHYNLKDISEGRQYNKCTTNVTSPAFDWALTIIRRNNASDVREHFMVVVYEGNVIQLSLTTTKLNSQNTKYWFPAI